MLAKFVPAILALTITVPAHAEFVPDPTDPPVITQSSGTRYADRTIPIPRPPATQSVPTQTRQQCYEQIHEMLIARRRAGWSREASARLWVKQVDQCKRLPASGQLGRAPRVA
jgi:hypothetical protein